MPRSGAPRPGLLVVYQVFDMGVSVGDSRLSQDALRAIRRRCVTQLDRHFMVYVARGSTFTVVTVLEYWTGIARRSFFIETRQWDGANRERRRGLMSEFIQRVAASPSKSPEDPKLPRDFAARFPAITEFLTVGKYPDGSPRERSAITLMAGEAEGFRAVLNDRDNARSIWAVAGTAEGLFVSLEALLSDPRAPWRPSTPPRNQKGAR